MSLKPFLRPQLWQAIGWLIVVGIVVLSLMPPLQLESLGAPSWNDKFGHFIAYFVLSAWYAQLCATRRSMLLRVGFCLLLGLTMEALQSLTDTRSADWRDMLANCVGVLGGSALWFTSLGGVLLRWEQGRWEAR